MRKIAIIKTDHRWDDYDNQQVLIDKITDFTEVDDATYAILINAQYHNGFRVLAQPVDQERFIQETVADYLEMIKEQERKDAERKAAEAEKKRQRDLKKKAKTEEEQKKLLEDLIKIHGVPEGLK